MSTTPKSPSPPTAPSNDEETLAVLEAEFSSLDGALVAAIYWDSTSYEVSRETLVQLAAATSAADEYDATDCASASETDPTTFSMSSLRVSDPDDDYGSVTPPEEGGEIDHMKELAIMFPNIKPYSLRATLSKCNGDFDRATDELLNREFLDRDEDVEKGIDGFCADSGNLSLSGTSKRQRRKKNKGTGLRVADLPSPEQTVGKKSWDKISKDIEQLANDLHLPKSTVGNAYHAHGGALMPTLVALLDANPPDEKMPPYHPDELSTLRAEFPEVAVRHLQSLLRLCENNHSAVFTYADALNSRRPLAPLVPQYAPPSPSTPPQRGNTAQAKGSNFVTVGMSMESAPPSPIRPYGSAAAMANGNRALRSAAFTQATQHYRRSKSDRLMAGAALYYAEIGREANKKVHEYSEIAAEELVERNSTDEMLDLHGVTVQQAVKIAREKTTAWWVRCSEADERRAASRGGPRKPFRIVTGMGRHSKDGEPRLFPAVSKMLIREKWRISVDEGQILVLGVKK